MSFVTNITDRFHSLSGDGKRKVVLIAASIAVVIVAYGLINAFSKDPKTRAPKVDRKVQYDLLTGRESKSLGVDVISARLDSINKRIDRVEQGDSGKGGKSAKAGAESRERDLVKEQQSDSEVGWDSMQDDPKLSEEDRNLLREIRSRRNGEAAEQQDDRRSRSGSGKSRDVVDNSPSKTPIPVVPPIQVQPDPNPVPVGPSPINAGKKIKSFGEKEKSSGTSADSSDSSSKTENGKKKEGLKKVSDGDTITLPAGSILSGTLITGMDASSSTSAKREPFPALLRIKAEAILPNRFRMDVRECFMIASGFADLSSERAYMRAETISCVKDDGTILETTVDAYAVGEDGKAGIRGRLVSKEGAMIARSLMAGFLSGVSNAMKPARVPVLSLNPDNGYQTERPDMSTIAQNSALSGISGSTTEIAKYYLEMARNMFPVIEVDAGRKVDFIVSRGVRLSGQGNANENLRFFNGQNQGPNRMNMGGNNMMNQFGQYEQNNANNNRNHSGYGNGMFAR